MKILFVHQNFPGQFKFLAPALAKQGHEVVGMHMQKRNQSEWEGIRLVYYNVGRSSTAGVHPWVLDFEAKVIRAEACFRAALELRRGGYTPDLIVAHHGWGESMFLRRVWPDTPMGIYCEFHYHPTGFDVGFDKEFPPKDPADECRVILKNLNNLVHFDYATAGISPTKWQADTFPQPFRDKISVVHDGIDTNIVVPRPNIMVKLKLDQGDLELRRDDDVVTFVNRNLEPYRGYHVFMRALPQILKRRPKARVLMVGGNDVSYGARSETGRSWKDIFIDEVRPQISDQDWSRVHFLGSLPYDQFLGLLQVTSAHVYLTYPFVLSWSLLESMSAECPIIGSITPPVEEVITHNKNGLLVPFFDVDALAEAVVTLLENRDLGQRLGKAARAHAVANYDLNTVCLPQQMHWLQSLISQSATPPNLGILKGDKSLATGVFAPSYLL